MSIWGRLKDEATNNAVLIRSSRHAAAITLRGVVVSTGVNKLKTHPLMAFHSTREGQVYLHAEMDAIVKFLSRYGQEILSDVELYVLRINKMKKMAYSRPCTDCCLHALKAFNVPVIHYTTGNPLNPVATEYL